jgi:ribonuclease Z
MSLSFAILGGPGQDNALLVRIDTGQSISRLLFDCGEGCLTPFPLAEIQAIDHLFFSHFHMDHVAGFDSFFRATFDRTARPNCLWGPPDSAAILQHRFQGYGWNLCADFRVPWRVFEIGEDSITTTRFELGEAFRLAHPEGSRPFSGVLVETAAWSVEAWTMEHGTPSIAYLVREKPRWNVDLSRMEGLGLPPGPWLKTLKDPSVQQGTVSVEGREYDLAELRSALLIETPGDSVAYLTDFRLDEAGLERLAQALRGCRTMVCESQYRQADLELASRNHHLTCTLAAEAARRAGVEELVLFHVSTRYTPEEWTEMLSEARAVFPRTRFPEHWRLPR